MICLIQCGSLGRGDDQIVETSKKLLDWLAKLGDEETLWNWSENF